MHLYGHLFHIKTGVMGSTRELHFIIFFLTGCSLLVDQWIESGYRPDPVYKLVTRVLEGVG